MTVKEFREKADSLLAPDSAEMEIEIPGVDGRKGVSDVRLEDGHVMVVTAGCSGPATYRVSYMITKDGRSWAFDVVRREYQDDVDMQLSLGDLRKELMEDRMKGLDADWRGWERRGTVEVPFKESVPVRDPKTDAVEIVEKDVPHFYGCKLLEAFRELDPDNDMFVRVWKDGNVS
jgi:hypothetical protein